MDKASRALMTHGRMWYLFDAKSQRPGAAANKISQILQGKHKPIYDGSDDCGDHVVVINAKHVEFSGKKWDKKLYRHHTGFPGGFREQLAKHVHEKKPLEVLRKATIGMLPRNRLRGRYMNRLHLFENEKHPFADNIYAEIKGKRAGEDKQLVTPYVLRAPGDLHELEEMFRSGEYELEAHIPAIEDPPKTK
eukprot:m.69696 g.69696  ORF g.69696 m.69696 type:complete len:192 (+) comp16043_c0_seq2:186-761(+)